MALAEVALSTPSPTVLGTFIALALVRHRFRGRGATNVLIFLPMATPEIVLGASLLTFIPAGPERDRASRPSSSRT